MKSAVHQWFMLLLKLTQNKKHSLKQIDTKLSFLAADINPVLLVVLKLYQSHMSSALRRNRELAKSESKELVRVFG